MLTKGIIQSIDYNDNTCIVRMPVFETAGTREQITASSKIVSFPGVYGGYKVNDVVIVGFENEEYGDPVLIGKLFLGNTEESKNEGGAVNCTNLTVSSSAVLPATTQITYDYPEGAIKNTEAVLSTYKSIKEIAEAVASNSKRISTSGNGASNTFSESEQVIGSWLDGSLLYQRTFYYTKGTTKISLTDINFNTVWIDSGQSFYIDIVYGTRKVSNPLFTSIDLQNKYIDLPALTSDDGYGYVTIKYTKK